MSDFLNSVTALQDGRRPSGTAWLDSKRDAELERFRSAGLPTSRDEDWRHTSLKSLNGTAFSQAPDVTIDAALLPELARLDLNGPRLVFVDGRFHASLSQIEEHDGVRVGSIAATLADEPELLREHLAASPGPDNPVFGALNTAFLVDGGLVLVDEDVEVAEPIHLVFLSTAGEESTVAHPRVLIVAGARSRVTVVESYVATGTGRYLNNLVSEVFVGDKANVDHYRIQSESDAAFHLASGESRQGRNSNYRLQTIHLGGALVRHDLRAVLDGEGGDCVMNGLHLAYGKRHLDSHTVIEHAKPHCDSRELYKAILSDEARSVFKGRIIVRQDAQQTDAVQSNPNLLLSDRALAHSLPQLEIYADDVKCTHGATIGRLDDDAVFYLRSRGIPETEARQLLTAAFVGEVLDSIEIEPLREHLQDEVSRRLPFHEANA